ncbi:uncharacterized protein LOC125129645 isoform X23 [Phacochoerus africanus]|uniref:uncharacterized protein LOC125129645 isoform X23 n=1 Tax=Phacochoerus africanus TaxID=41426 RepID=UPI001FDA0AEA|nr:uncharacterized protein LOC125129645 isoform X23 [Phacochoerus africanus]
MVKLDLNMESQDQQFEVDRALPVASREIPLDMANLVMGNTHTLSPERLEEGDLVRVSPVTVKGIQEPRRGTPHPHTGRLDLNTESQDQQFEVDRALPVASREIPLDMANLVMGNPHTLSPERLEEGDLVRVSPVTVKGIQEPHRGTRHSHTGRLDLNMESQDQQFEVDRALPVASREIPLDMANLVMGNTHTLSPERLEEGDLVRVSPVTVKGIQEPRRGTPHPHTGRLDLNMEIWDPQLEADKKQITDRLDLNMESQDQQFEVDRALPVASREIPLDMANLVMGNTHTLSPERLEEGDLVRVSPVTVKGIQEPRRGTPHPHTGRLDLNMEIRDPQLEADKKQITDRLDLNMESQDQQFEVDRALPVASREIPLDMANLVMGNPHTLSPERLEEGDLVRVSPVTVKGIQELRRGTPHPHTGRLDLNMEIRDPQLVADKKQITDRLDLNMESQDQQFEVDRALPVASQEIPLDMANVVMGNTHTLSPEQLEEGDLVRVSPVTVKGIQEPRRGTPHPHTGRLDLNMEIQDPQLEADKKQITDRLDLNTESQDQQFEVDRALPVASREIPLDMANLVMGNPHTLSPERLEEGDLVRVSPVTVKGIQEPHRGTRHSHTGRLDLNMESQDQQFEVDRALPVASREIPLDMANLVMGNPHTLSPERLEEGDLVRVSPVTVKGIQEPRRGTRHSHTGRLDLNMEIWDPQLEADKKQITDRLDLNMESQDQQFEVDRALPVASREIPLDMANLVMGNTHTLSPERLEEGDLVRVSPVTVKGIQELRRGTPHPHTGRLDLNMEIWDPQLEADKKQITDRLDLNMESQDQQFKVDRALPVASREIPLDMANLVMGNPHTLSPERLEEGDLVRVSPVTVKGIQEPRRGTPHPHTGRLDLNTESQDQQFEVDRALPVASREIPLDMANLVMGNTHTLSPERLEEGDLVRVSPVTVKGIQEPRRGTPHPHTGRLDLNMEIRDPQLEADKKQITDRLDLNTESQDQQFEVDRALPVASREIPLDMANLVMGNPHTLTPERLEEGDLVRVSPVTVKGIQEPHRGTRHSHTGRLDLNMERLDIQDLVQ